MKFGQLIECYMRHIFDFKYFAAVLFQSKNRKDSQINQGAYYLVAPSHEKDTPHLINSS